VRGSSLHLGVEAVDHKRKKKRKKEKQRKVLLLQFGQ